MMRTATLSKQWIEKLLIGFEVGSRAYYDKECRGLHWPGGQSGLTVGFGYDLGYQKASDVQAAWGNYVTPAMMKIMLRFVGLKGQAAKAALASAKGVDVPYDVAAKQFFDWTLIKAVRDTVRIFPNLIRLHPIEQTAFVGLVYNRGNGLKGESRKEMLALVAATNADNDKQMAKLVRDMKRLWADKKLTGLLDRRDAEAAAIELPDDTQIPESDIIRFAIG